MPVPAPPETPGAPATLAVCYCVDAPVAASAALSVWTLLDALRPGVRVHLHVFEDAAAPPVPHVADVAGRFRDRADLTVHRVDLGRFAGLQGLHGDLMAYARLLIPETIPDEWVVYLDTDTLVMNDVSGIVDGAEAGVPLYAVPVGVLSASLERKLFEEEGLDLDGPMFNSGVLVVNAGAWRRDGLTERLLGLARRLNGRYKGADQALLNVAFAGRFGELERRYNYVLADYIGQDDPAIWTSAIVHFVGSPKPWDLFGSVLHPHHRVYAAQARRSGLGGVLRRSRYASSSLARYARIAGPYARAFQKRLARRP